MTGAKLTLREMYCIDRRSRPVQESNRGIPSVYLHRYGQFQS
jgi:hypothetical protein